MEQINKEAIDFAEWIAKYQYERDEDDGLWRYWDNGIGEHTTEELFNIFKKEIHGTTQSTTTL